MRQKARLALLGTFVILLDQISKNYASFNWSTSCNKGIAFGVSLPDQFGIFFSIVILALIFYLFCREKRILSEAGLALIFAGGISNLADRLTVGCVRDFIEIPLWPTSFNLADLSITVGALILLYQLLPLKKDKL